jgi:alpha 1,3-glucosidase
LSTMQLLPLLLLLPLSTIAVKREDFKTCSQSAFCRRLRSLSSRSSSSPDTWHSPYAITSPPGGHTLEGESTLRFDVASELYPEAQFEIKLDIVGDGIARVRMDEIHGLRQRYDEAARWTLVEGALNSSPYTLSTDESSTNVTYSSSEDTLTLSLSHSPLLIALYRSSSPNPTVPEVVINGRGLLHMEHFRLKPGADETSSTEQLEAATDEERAQSVVQSPIDRSWFEGEKGDWENGLWEEKFRTWTDSKPKGERHLLALLLSLGLEGPQS